MVDHKNLTRVIAYSLREKPSRWSREANRLYYLRHSMAGFEYSLELYWTRGKVGIIPASWMTEEDLEILTLAVEAQIYESNKYQINCDLSEASEVFKEWL